MIGCVKTGNQGNSGNQHVFPQKGSTDIRRCKRDLMVGTCDKGCDMLRGRNSTFWAASDKIWQSRLISLILRVFFYTPCVSLLKLKSVNLIFPTVICKLINLHCNVCFMNKFTNETEISEYI